MSDRLQTLANWFRPLANLLMYYPLLFALAVGMVPLAFGCVLTEYDAFHLVWNDVWWVGVVNGLLTSFILGMVMMTVFVCDEYTAAHPVAGAARPWVMPPGRAYPFGWLLGQLVIASPAVWETLPAGDGGTGPFGW